MRSGLLAFLGIVGRQRTAETEFRQGDKASQKGNFDLAISCYTDAIRLNPKYAKAYYSRGAAYSEKGDHDKAQAGFAEAKKLGFPSKGETKWAESHHD
jgi:Flp pilus assembly protein TadD